MTSDSAARIAASLMGLIFLINGALMLFAPALWVKVTNRWRQAFGGRSWLLNERVMEDAGERTGARIAGFMMVLFGAVFILAGVGVFSPHTGVPPPPRRGAPRGGARSGGLIFAALGLLSGAALLIVPQRVVRWFGLDRRFQADLLSDRYLRLLRLWGAVFMAFTAYAIYLGLSR